MSKVEKAVECFNEGYSCSQAVLSTYGLELGLNRELAMRIASGFGGGMARTDDACGAVTGAVMVIGLSYGGVDVDDTDSKTRTYEVVNEFLKRFSAKHGSIQCTELLGHDLSDPVQLEKVKSENISGTICPKFVASAAEILEELL